MSYFSHCVTFFVKKMELKKLHWKIKMSVTLDSTRGNTFPTPSPDPNPLWYIGVLWNNFLVKSYVTNGAQLCDWSCTCMASRGQHNSEEWQELETRKSQDWQALRRTGWKAK